MDMEKYRTLFLQEAGTHLQTMSRLISSDAPCGAAGIDALFRCAHSIKGMAASMGYEDLTRLCHELENRLGVFRGGGSIPEAAMGALEKALDFIESRLEAIAAAPAGAASARAPAPEGGPPHPLPPHGPAESEQPRLWNLRIELEPTEAAPAVRLMLLQREIAARGEAIETRPDAQTLAAGGELRSLHMRLRSTLDLADFCARLDLRPGIRSAEAEQEVQPPPAPPRTTPELVRVRGEMLDRLLDLATEMIAERIRLQEQCRKQEVSEMAAGLESLGKQLRRLHQDVIDARMMPLSQLTARLPRQLRELARKTGKEVRLRMEGEDLMLDRSILDAMSDPLMHILRNAVDHGIEERGAVSIRACRRGDRVLIEVRDDGRGMDPRHLRARALKKGLLSEEEVQALSDGESLMLICRPGFSTADGVTDLSGRGVGMDAVKAALEKVGGELRIESRPGLGSCFSLLLPLSAALVQLLLVRFGELLLGFPVSRIEAGLKVRTGEVRSQGARLVIEHRGEAIPLLSLGKILGQAPAAGSEHLHLLLTRVAGRRAALVVDGFEGIREAFIKPLSAPLNRIAGLSTSTILGSGEVLFVLDPQELLPVPNPQAAGETP